MGGAGGGRRWPGQAEAGGALQGGRATACVRGGNRQGFLTSYVSRTSTRFHPPAPEPKGECVFGTVVHKQGGKTPLETIAAPCSLGHSSPRGAEGFPGVKKKKKPQTVFLDSSFNYLIPN